MVSTLLTEVIKLAFIILSFIATRYIIPYLKTKLDLAKLNLAAEWATKFVKAAQNIYDGGEVKLEVVTKWLSEKCKDKNIQLSEEDIRALIEDAYTEMKNAATKDE